MQSRAGGDVLNFALSRCGPLLRLATLGDVSDPGLVHLHDPHVVRQKTDPKGRL